MISMARLVVVAALVASLGLTVWGCGDDDTVQTEDFQVTISVRDTLGHPVEGLELTLIPDTPVLPEIQNKDVDPIPVRDELNPCWPNPFNPMTMIRFEVSTPTFVVLNILDVEKDIVMTMVADQLVAGLHQVIWDSQNILDEVQPGGVYYAQITYYPYEGGEARYTAEVPMLLANWGMNGPAVGVTDAQGKVVLKDRTLFPFLFDVEPFEATDENGEVFGMINCTAKTRFFLTDPDRVRTLRYDRDVSSGDEYHFIWK